MEHSQLSKQTPVLQSKTQWSESGRSILPNQKPWKYRHGKYSDYGVYSIDQTRPKRVPKRRDPVGLDLLVAIQAVNRAAKRYRNAAFGCYSMGRYRAARSNRLTKERLYELMDRGVAMAWMTGQLLPTVMRGALTEYTDPSGAHLFYSCVRPRSWLVIQSTDTQPVFEGAEARTFAEPRLKDAEFTLASLPKVDLSLFVIEDPPKFESDPAPEPWAEDEDDEDSFRSSRSRHRR